MQPIVTQPRPRDYAPSGVPNPVWDERDIPPPTYTETVSRANPEDCIEGENQVPEDLEYLSRLSQVRVYQQLDELDANHLKTAFDRENRYFICNTDDQAFSFAKEVSETAWRICSNTRPMTIDVTDDYGHHVMKLVRPYRCKAHWCCCCRLQELTINYPVDTPFAHVQEVWTPWVPALAVRDQSDRLLYTVRGEWLGSRLCCRQAFHVYDASGVKAAVVTKSSESCIEWFALMNDFRITYEDHVSAQGKLIILGLAFLLDLLYMEVKP